MRIHNSLIVAALLLTGTALGAQSPARSLATTQQRLADRFRPLAQRAVAPAATRADRAALVTFLRGEVLPYLAREGAVVYPLVDSIAGTDGYVTIAAMFDQDAITGSVNALAAQVGTKDAARFAGETHALAALLATYFRREELLVQPMLEARLSGKDVAAVVARVNAPGEAWSGAGGNPQTGK